MKKIQLFCLPYAGGGPEFFRPLKEMLDGRITVHALEYAGHGGRRKQPFYADFTELARDMAQRINEQLDDDSTFLLFGYSMGTIGVYEMIAQKLLRRQPQHVFLASHEAPDGQWDSKRYLGLTDEQFWDAMKQFGGLDNVDDKMLHNRFFKHLYFVPIREDYRLLGNYPANHRGEFCMPVTVFYAPDDIPDELIHGWDSFCRGGATYIALGQHHFFLKTCAEQTAQIIEQTAQQLTT